jgi:isopropylmalate/homocitrate/citramalate synthase
MKEHVQIIEIGPREGIQNHPNYIDVQSKVSLIDMLFDAGFQKITDELNCLSQKRSRPETLKEINSIVQIAEQTSGEHAPPFACPFTCH